MNHEIETRPPNTGMRALTLLLMVSSATIGRAEFVQIDTGGELETPAEGGGASWGDYDGDGDVDLFVTERPGGPNVLCRNLGGGRFDRPGVAEGGDRAGCTGV